MKKALLWGAALLALFVCMGCEIDPEVGPDGQKTPAGWTTGVGMIAQTGDNPGEIKYSFTAAEAGGAAISYKLYYAEGNLSSAVSILTALTVQQDEVEPGNGVIFGFPGRSYSIVIEATSSTVSGKAYSEVRNVTAKAAPSVSGGKTLKITGIPPTAKIDFVSLEDDDGDTIAIGLNKSGTFTLYPYNNETDDLNWNEAWNGAGAYYITLYDELTGKEYFYTNGLDLAADGPQTYNFTEATSTIAWDKFKTLESYRLTITGIPTEAGIIGGSLLDASMIPVAAGVNVFGTISFVEFDPDTFEPDFNKPFAVPGQYFIVLSNSMTGTGDNYFYTAGGQTQALYTFPATASITWSDFAIVGGASEDPDQLVLTVTGMDSTILVATLSSSSSVVATSIKNGVTFAFCEPGPGSMPDTSKPFTTAGSYFISLMVIDIPTQTPTATYVYTTNGTDPALYYFSGAKTIAWSSFTLQQGSSGEPGEPGEPGGPTDDALELTVTGSLPSNIFAAALFSDLTHLENNPMGNVVAYALKGAGGKFTFATISPAGAFTTTGSYFLALTTNIPGMPGVTNYVYKGSAQNPTKYNFTQLTGNNIGWDQFAVYTGEQQQQNDDPLTLTVTGALPATITGASLLGPQGNQPVAVAVNAQGTFIFYEPGANSIPDTSKPFTTPGSYSIFLAEVDMQTFQVTGAYMYTGTGTYEIPYSFTAQPASIAWSHFTPQSALTQPPEQLTLTVDDIPTEKNILGASLLNASIQPVAVAVLSEDTFIFFAFTSGAVTDTPFTTPGNYHIAMADDLSGIGNNYFYTAGGQVPVQYTFPATVSLSWDDFALVVQGATGGLELSVTDIPDGTGIIAAILSDTSNPQVPVAIATDLHETGTFIFSFPDISNPLMPMPTNIQFTVTGTYNLILATQAGTQYMYTGNQGGGYTFDDITDNTVEWTNNFVDLSTLGP